MRRRITSLSLLAFLGLGTAAFAQVTGVVNDADNFPEADVEVSVKGTDKVVYTDQDGKFDIDAKIGDILVVNGKEFSVTSNALGTLKYANATSSTVDLSEVVVKSIFNAPSKSGVTTVKAKDLEQMNPSVSIDQMLGGKVAGLSSQAMSGAPGATANVTIRGAIGLNGGVKSPLYVVDGTYMSATDVVAINPADIEEVRVLKDASQLAIFGSRGANGVIIMKTKSAKKGEATVSYSSRIGVNQMVDLPNINLMNAEQLLNYQNGLSTIGNLGLGQARTSEEIATLSKNNHKWSDDLYKNGLTSSHFITINKNDGDTSNNFSVGYDKNEGAVRYYNGMERITATFNNTTKVKDWLRYGINLNGSYTTLDSPRDRVNAQSPFYNTLLNRPYETFYSMDANGNVVLDADGNKVYNPNANYMGYPVADEMEKTDAQTRYLRIYGTGFVEADLAKNVTARTTLGATYNRTQYENFLKPSSVLSQLLGDGGSKTDRSTDRFDYNWRNEVSYENTFAGKHHLRVTAASEYINQSLYSMTMYGIGFPNDYLQTQGLATLIEQDSKTNRWRISKFGYLGAASYDFANKYFVDAYIRRDGTSLAGVDNKYGTFWGVSLGWNIAKEGFLRDSKAVNNLTLKASYGEVGDDSGLAAYANMNLMNILNTYNGNPASFPITVLADNNATWEANKKFNIGLDFGFFGNRLTGAMAYFHDLRSDFLFNKQLPLEAGGYTTTINAGEIKTEGFELELNYDVIRSKNFDLSLYGNVTSLKYKVNQLADGDNLIMPDSYESMIHVEGGKPYQFYMVRYAGVDTNTGKDLYLDRDGNITDVYDGGDAVATNKSSLPTLMGGFGLNAKFYGFDINADFTYSAGGYMYNNTYAYLTDPTSLDNHVVEAADYWKQAGDNASFALPNTTGPEYSTKYLEKSDYIAFRSLSLGYNFTDLVKGTFIKNLRMFAQVQNLALWTNYHGNPIAGTGTSESSAVGSSGYVSNSFTAFSYPLVRSYSIGFNVSF